MRVLVAYYSLSNNTQLLANTLGGHLANQHAVTVSTINSMNPMDLEYDLVIICSPCHDGDLAKPVKNFLQKLPNDPSFKMAGVYCHATYRRKDPHPRAQEIFDRWAAKGVNSFHELSIMKNVDLLGVFNCMGAPTPEIMDFIHRVIIPDEKEWEIYKDEVMRHPTKTDLINLIDFAELILKEAEFA